MDLALVNFDAPSEVREFERGRFEVYAVGPMTLGRATYEPGWKWSLHVGKSVGKSLCDVEHIGIVIAGSAAAALTDRRIIEMHAGDVFYIPPGHDSWVIGDEPYISLHVMGAADYAAKSIEA